MTNANALPDDPNWCGHPFVSIRTWTCAYCDRPVTEATQQRLKSASPVAPKGSVWVLLSGYMENSKIDAGMEYTAGGGFLNGVYSDRSRIPRLLVKSRWDSAAGLRADLARTHIYQGVFNINIFEGYEESPDRYGYQHNYKLTIERIDADDA